MSEAEASVEITKILTALYTVSGKKLMPVPRSKVFRASSLREAMFPEILALADAGGYIRIIDETNPPREKIGENQYVPGTPRVEKQRLVLTPAGLDAIKVALADGRPVEGLASGHGNFVVHGNEGSIISIISGRGNTVNVNSKGLPENVRTALSQALVASWDALESTDGELSERHRRAARDLLVQASADAMAVDEAKLSRLDMSLGKLDAIFCGAAGGGVYELATRAINAYFKARGI
jgi:uncharacterized membrane protein